MPPELLAQFGLLEDALRALGVVVWPMVEFEADDGLAAAAARFADEPAVERVVILSPDKDMAQCVRPDGRVRDLRPASGSLHRRRRGRGEVRRATGLHPRLPGPRRRQRRRLSRACPAGGASRPRPSCSATRTSRTSLTRSAPGTSPCAAPPAWPGRSRSTAPTPSSSASWPPLRLDAPIPQHDPDELRWHGPDRPAFDGPGGAAARAAPAGASTGELIPQRRSSAPRRTPQRRNRRHATRASPGRSAWCCGMAATMPIGLAGHAEVEPVVAQARGHHGATLDGDETGCADVPRRETLPLHVGVEAAVGRRRPGSASRCPSGA